MSERTVRLAAAQVTPVFLDRDGTIATAVSVTEGASARLQANAIEVPSPATDVLCAAARRAGTMVVMGINERDVTYSRGTLYNSLLYISAAGEMLGVHRKLMPTHAE